MFNLINSQKREGSSWIINPTSYICNFCKHCNKNEILRSQRQMIGFEYDFPILVHLSMIPNTPVHQSYLDVGHIKLQNIN
jgi:hypothetical protein